MKTPKVIEMKYSNDGITLYKCNSCKGVLSFSDYVFDKYKGFHKYKFCPICGIKWQEVVFQPDRRHEHYIYKFPKRIVYLSVYADEYWVRKGGCSELYQSTLIGVFNTIQTKTIYDEMMFYKSQNQCGTNAIRFRFEVSKKDPGSTIYTYANHIYFGCAWHVYWEEYRKKFGGKIRPNNRRSWFWNE